jgi:hypothetical protein
MSGCDEAGDAGHGKVFQAIPANTG